MIFTTAEIESLCLYKLLYVTKNGLYLKLTPAGWSLLEVLCYHYPKDACYITDPQKLARRNYANASLPVPVNILLEEACNVGYLADFKRTISVCRSHAGRTDPANPGGCAACHRGTANKAARQPATSRAQPVCLYSSNRPQGQSTYRPIDVGAVVQ